MKCLVDMSNNMTVLSSLYRDAYEFTLIKRYNLLKANIKSASNFAVNNFPAEFNYVTIYNMKILLVLFWLLLFLYYIQYFIFKYFVSLNNWVTKIKLNKY